MNLLTSQEQMEKVVNEVLYEHFYGEYITMNGLLKPTYESCSFEEQSLELSFPVKKWQRNPDGILHGGVTATMLDSTLGMLAHCILNKGRVTTTEFFISYIKPITEGDELFVRAVIKNAGKQLIRVYGEGYRKSDGKIVCTANGAFMVLKNNK